MFGTVKLANITPVYKNIQIIQLGASLNHCQITLSNFNATAGKDSVHQLRDGRNIRKKKKKFCCLSYRPIQSFLLSPT